MAAVDAGVAKAIQLLLDPREESKVALWELLASAVRAQGNEDRPARATPVMPGRPISASTRGRPPMSTLQSMKLAKAHKRRSEEIEEVRFGNGKLVKIKIQQQQQQTDK